MKLKIEKNNEFLICPVAEEATAADSLPFQCLESHHFSIRYIIALKLLLKRLNVAYLLPENHDKNFYLIDDDPFND